MEELEGSSRLGVDVNQANHLGRIPLHTHCGKGWYDAFLSTQLLKHTRWILERTSNSETVDAEGMRRLYLASMMSEYFVKGLLAFSADPAGTIHEGLTPLHLAARGRRATW
jgi:ankyrin repeat protein